MIKFWNIHCRYLSLTFLVFAFSNSMGGEIRGKVIIKRAPPISSKIVSRSIIQKYITKTGPEHDISAKVKEEVPSVVIYIEDIQTDGESSNGKIVIMDQTQENFVPHILPILVETQVRFLNSDKVYHNVFSYSSAKSFDLGRYGTGKYRSVKFNKPGVVKIYCDIHTHMNAFILVLKNTFFTLTDEEGNFEIKNVPPGTYTVKAWYGRWPEKAERVVVKSSEVTKINFVFP